jgi:hypothetical protein
MKAKVRFCLGLGDRLTNRHDTVISGPNREAIILAAVEQCIDGLRQMWDQAEQKNAQSTRS